MTNWTLAQLRARVMFELVEHDPDWITPTAICKQLRLGGKDVYKVSLTLERLTVDGFAEIKTPGSTVRRFRRRRAA